jgi:hypothetical protein
MAEKPQDGAPEAPSLPDRTTLIKMAHAIMPFGELRRYAPKHPAWCRRIGEDVCVSLLTHREPDPTEIPLLLDAHARAVARRDRAIEDKWKEEALRDLARRIERREPVPPGELDRILGTHPLRK